MLARTGAILPFSDSDKPAAGVGDGLFVAAFVDADAAGFTIGFTPANLWDPMHTLH